MPGKVGRGDKLRIKADTWNTLLNVAAEHNSLQAQNSKAGRGDAVDCGLYCLVRNDSGNDVPRFGILGIDGPVFSPETEGGSFDSRIVLKVVSPVTATHGGRFVVLMAPCPDGAIRRACIGGVVQATVVMNSADDWFAGVADDELATLTSSQTGPAEIIWRAGDTGPQSAIIRLGGGPRLVRFGQAVDDWDGTNEVEMDPCDVVAGVGVDNGQPNLVCYIVNPGGEDPSFAAVSAGDVFPFVMIDKTHGLLLGVRMLPIGAQYEVLQSDENGKLLSYYCLMSE